jgi:hypothetical protein
MSFWASQCVAYLRFAGSSTGKTTGLTWLFADHLGSASIAADASGVKTSEQNTAALSRQTLGRGATSLQALYFVHGDADEVCANEVRHTPSNTATPRAQRATLA